MSDTIKTPTANAKQIRRSMKLSTMYILAGRFDAFLMLVAITKMFAEAPKTPDPNNAHRYGVNICVGDVCVEFACMVNVCMVNVLVVNIWML